MIGRLRNSIRNGGWATWTLIVLVVLLAAAPILTYPLGRDQGEFAIIGVTILRGGLPYVDAWNPKPPAIFYIYAGLIHLFGQATWAIRIADLVAFPAMAAALYGIGRELRGNALGLWAVMLWGAFYFTETFWTLSQNDGLASVPMALAVWALLILLRDASSPRMRVALAFLIGALAALTLWFKYPYIFFVAALVIGYLIERRRWIWAEVGGFTGGGLLVGHGSLGIFEAYGASLTGLTLFCCRPRQRSRVLRRA
ncbi:MAG: glycosyltransferase family 39 protein, partial [Chloroflexota bacterium]